MVKFQVKIRKEAWYYRTISGVRLHWEIEEPKGAESAVRSQSKERGSRSVNGNVGPAFPEDHSVVFV